MMNFGYLPEDVVYETSVLNIEPLSEISNIVKQVNSEGIIHDGWIYPPVEAPKPKPNCSDKTPQIPWVSFGLPSTHKIDLKGEENKELCIFLLNVFGFLKGIKLIPENWVHFYRTAAKHFKLNSFHCLDHEITDILNLSSEYYFKNQKTNLNKLLFGAIHWHLFGQSYEHDFEKFDCEYKVLDTCFKIAKELYKITSNNHASRPVELCKLFDMPIPHWAKIENNSSYLSNLRNDFYHEALFAKEPIGFGSPDPGIVYELRCLNSKFILALLGVKAEYIKYPADKEYALHSLDMK